MDETVAKYLSIDPARASDTAILDRMVDMVISHASEDVLAELGSGWFSWKKDWTVDYDVGEQRRLIVKNLNALKKKLQERIDQAEIKATEAIKAVARAADSDEDTDADQAISMRDLAIATKLNAARIEDVQQAVISAITKLSAQFEAREARPSDLGDPRSVRMTGTEAPFPMGGRQERLAILRSGLVELRGPDMPDAALNIVTEKMWADPTPTTRAIIDRLIATYPRPDNLNVVIDAPQSTRDKLSSSEARTDAKWRDMSRWMQLLCNILIAEFRRVGHATSNQIQDALRLVRHVTAAVNAERRPALLAARFRAQGYEVAASALSPLEQMRQDFAYEQRERGAPIVPQTMVEQFDLVRKQEKALQSALGLPQLRGRQGRAGPPTAGRFSRASSPASARSGRSGSSGSQRSSSFGRTRGSPARTRGRAPAARDQHSRSSSLSRPQGPPNVGAAPVGRGQ
jgi:hypothetical protein